MIPTKKSIFVLALIYMTQAFQTQAQDYSVHRVNKVFFGLYGGANFTHVKVKDSYQVLVPLDNSSSIGEKEYGKMKDHVASQFGFNLSYGFAKQFSLVLQPGVYNYKFEYLSNFHLNDTIEMMPISKEMLHQQKINYITVPLMIRWDMSKKQFSPYVQVGGFVDFRFKSSKAVFMDNVIDNEVDIEQTQIQTSRADINDHVQRYHFGLVGGFGLSYFTKYFVIGLEANYRFGLSSVINDRNRYSDQTGFTSFYLDVLDQVRMRNVNVQLNVTFPLNSMKSTHILRKTKY